MGCATCGGAIAAAGSAPHTAIVIGDNTGSPVRVVASSSVASGVPTGRSVWVRGSGVQAFIDSGVFVAEPIPVRVVAEQEQRGANKLWRVGEISYSDLSAARARAQVTGEPIHAYSI